MARVLTDRDPGDETSTRFDLDVLKWRYDELIRHGYPPALAIALAEQGSVDLHDACELVENGASVEEAVRILL